MHVGRACVRFAGICSSCTDLKSRLISFRPSPMKCWLKWNNGRRARLKRCLPLSLDALRLQIREEGSVKNKAVSLALGMGADDCQEVLGLWIEQTEGAKCWLKVFNELRNRGFSDLLIAVVDGLHGFPDATQPSIRRPSQTCRPFDPQFTVFCPLERAQTFGRRAQAHLPGRP